MGLFDRFRRKPTITMQLACGSVLTLDRLGRWFEGEIPWCGGSCHLDLRADEEGASTADLAAHIFERIRENEAEFDAMLRDYAVREMLPLACDWEEREITEEEFRRRIDLTSIFIYPSGDCDFWFDHDEIFTDHVVSVTWNIEKGFDRADIVG